ncbi:MAG: peptidoglycan editing factor PgeF [Candidatus Moranbacteria bacterium]|nr:peptidoglycan editing factor PgeF [Candidatus Moranbacteria bacterium]
MIEFFKKFPEIKAVMSEKADGSMKLLPGGVNAGNRNDFFAKIGIEGDRVFSADLTHSHNVKKVFADSPRIISDTDALVTAERNCFLSVTVADCLPILFFESEKKLVGIAHAGWRGLLRGIVENTIAEMVSLGGSVENLYVEIGPAIGKCHFEIKEDILDNFRDYADFVEKKNGKYSVDLKGIAKNKIISRGIPASNIGDGGHCTYSDSNLFSYRRDKPETVQAGIVLIGIK